MKALLAIVRVAMLLAAAVSAAAMQPLEIVNVILIGAATPEQRDRLVITGRNFDLDRDVSLTLGEFELDLLELTSTAILAEIPGELSPGRYELVAWSEGGRVREHSVIIVVEARAAEDESGEARLED